MEEKEFLEQFKGGRVARQLEECGVIGCTDTFYRRISDSGNNYYINVCPRHYQMWLEDNE